MPSEVFDSVQLAREDKQRWIEEGTVRDEVTLTTDFGEQSILFHNNKPRKFERQEAINNIKMQAKVDKIRFRLRKKVALKEYKSTGEN